MHDTASLKHKIRYSEPRVSSVYDFKFSEPRFGEGVFVRIPDTDEDGISHGQLEALDQEWMNAPSKFLNVFLLYPHDFLESWFFAFLYVYRSAN